MIKKFLLNIIVAIAGFWLAFLVVPGIQVSMVADSGFFGFSLTQPWQMILLFGIILGLLNFFVKPILNAITLPLRIITLGLFSFVVNAALIWIVDAAFKEVSIPLWLPLLFTTLIIFALQVVLSLLIKEK